MWRRRAPLSAHLIAEVEHVAEYGPLEPHEPVPGCGCALCLTLAAGGTWEDARHVAAIVRELSRLWPDEREGAAAEWLDGVDLPLPSPGVLAALAALDPGARPDRPRRTSWQDPNRRREPLPVEDARAADILAVAARLGLGEPRKAGRNEYRVRCPFHDDSDPSLTLTADAGLWYCFPCGLGGDVIELVRRVRDVPFADAVRELAGRAA